MTTTPEEQALIEAAVKWADAPMFSGGNKLVEAVAAYRATLTPKECRPPSDAKDGSLWWLAHKNDDAPSLFAWRLNDDEYRPQYQWHPLYAGAWKMGPFSPEHMHNQGWTVHSPCTFPGEHEATDEAVAEFFAARNWEFNPIAFRQIIAALNHFGRPKLRDITDAEIRGIGCAEFGFCNDPELKFARAVERLIKGEEV